MAAPVPVPARSPEDRRQRRLTLGLLGLLGLAVLAGAVLAVRFAEAQKARDLAAWEARLALIAQERAATLAAWVSRRQARLEQLVQNPSVQLYLQDVRDAPDGAEAQIGYLRNLLMAERDHFLPDRPAAATVPADVARPARGGLALLGPEGRLLTATPGLPDLHPALLPGTARPIQFLPEARMLVLSRPVRPVQAGDEAAPIGTSLVALPTAQGLAGLIRLPVEVIDSADTYLVFEQNGNLLPLSGGPDDAAAQASLAAESMAIAPDHRGRRVLAVAEPVAVAGLDWAVVRSVAAADVIAPITARRNRTLAALFFALLGLSAAILLIWRHGASVRVAAAHREQARLTQRFEALSQFLSAVSNSQPAAILALDGAGHIRFANTAAAARAGSAAEDLTGKSLDAAFGPQAALAFRQGEEEAEKTLDEAGPPRRVTRSRFLPLPGDAEEARLVVAEDITELVEAREKREDSLKRLVETLASLIDARDPYSAHHSAHVASVAGAIARAMKRPLLDVETVEIAGTLMNLGKILVPREVLTKRGELSAGELRAVRESLMKSADLLEHLAFEGPVADTLRQVQAHYDGSGRPEGLAGDDILITARILAVANAFVGMVSPRAHRDGLGFDAALAQLQAQAGRSFDRRVVSALAHRLDNEGGRSDWAHFAERPGLPLPAD